MNPQRFEESSSPVRLRYHSVPTGPGGGPVWPLFLFAAVFLLFGSVIILGILGYVPHSSESKAPDWVWGFMGYTFSLVGVAALVGAIYSLREAARRKTIAPDLPAMKDFAWDTAKFEVSGWRPVFENAAFAIFMTIFLVPFNWFCFADAGDWRSNTLAKIVIGTFDTLTLFMWLQTAKKLLHVRKFGASCIEFARFPFPLGQPVSLRLIPPASVASLNRGTFALRCVEQWTESHGSGDNRGSKIIQEAKWCGTWHLDDGDAFTPGQTIELSFTPPPHAPASSLSGARMIFWELVVMLEVCGLDFEALYLVPVY